MIIYTFWIYFGLNIHVDDPTLFRTSIDDQTLALFKAQEVEVRVIGENWNEANNAAQEFLQSNKDAFFVHPYDQESTWRGHATMITEIKAQLEALGVEQVPEAVITCVGGGGLAIGKQTLRSGVRIP